MQPFQRRAMRRTVSTTVSPSKKSISLRAAREPYCQKSYVNAVTADKAASCVRARARGVGSHLRAPQEIGVRVEALPQIELKKLPHRPHIASRRSRDPPPVPGECWLGARASPVAFAVRMRLGRSRSGPAWTCIEDLRVRTSSVAARSARPPRSYRVRHRRLELRTPPQERRGLCLSCVKRLTQGCGSTLEKSKTRLRLFSPASTPLER
jgi:hypothetical protein